MPSNGILALALLFLPGCGAEEASSSITLAAPQPTEALAPNDQAEPSGAEPPEEGPRSREYANPGPSALGTLPDAVGIAVGEPAPDATVQDFDGRARSLSSLWSERSVLLMFYRGGWCPFCNFQVHALAEAYPRFEARGITIAMISVDRPQEAARTRASWAIPFDVLSDPDLAAHRAYRVINEVDDEMLERLRGMGMDLEAHSGRDHHTVAIPAIFLIDARGVVRWAHADHDYRTRPSPEQILDALPPAP